MAQACGGRRARFVLPIRADTSRSLGTRRRLAAAGASPFYYYRTLNPEAYARTPRAARTELEIRGLEPGHNVLDIGCGTGNLAIGLAGFLEGRYEGVDVNREAVEWCQRAITPRHARFHFHHADVSSTAYNPKGRGDAAHYRYPFDNHTFDRFFLGSVLTHLLPDAFEGTIAKIARLLSPGGKCIASCFLMNDDNRQRRGGPQPHVIWRCHRSRTCAQRHLSRGRDRAR